MTTRNPDASVRIINDALSRVPVDIGGAVINATIDEVGLNAATLVALETVNSVVTNWPADFPDASTLAKLEQVRVLLAGTLSVTGPLTDAQLRAAAINVNTELSTDVFGAAIIGERYNVIEVHFDDTNWATYVTQTTSGGGGATQHQGHVHFTSGTGANGRSKAVTLDVVRYRPMHEVYAAWTAAFPTPGVANSYMRIGLADTNYANGLVIGYENTDFGLTWYQNSIATRVLRAAWDDPCDGSPGSAYTRSGAPEALDLTKVNIFRTRVGLLGSAPLLLEVLTPDGEWISVHTFKRPNLDAEPTFSNFDLTQLVEVRKTGADATDLEIRTACWGGGTTSTLERLSDAITDRSLAQTVRAVIEGKTPSGTYTKVTVNSQGRLQVTNDAVGTDGTAVPAGTTAVGGTDGTNLQTMKVDSAGTVYVTGSELLDIKRAITDYETRLDYDVRVDGNPVYVGKAPNGTATAAAGWTIQRFTYDVSARLTRAQVLTGTWDGRAALGW